MNNRQIFLEKVRVHNLKNITLSLKSRALIVFTGVSGSGKSSLAFDTIFAEGQRRFTQSLSHHFQQFLKQLPKPDAMKIENLSPTIAIEQKSIMRNPRSTVGTITGIYDYLRVLFAKIALPHCPISGEIVKPQSQEKILTAIKKEFGDKKILIIAPFVKGKKGSMKDEIKLLKQRGFIKLRVDNTLFDIEEIPALDPKKAHDIDIIIDRIFADESRIIDSVIQALNFGKGFVIIFDMDSEQEYFYSPFGYCQKSKTYYPPLEAHDFSFNHPKGMCDTCQGLGETFSFDLSKIIDPDKSIAEDCCTVAPHYETVRYGNIYRNLARIYNFDVDTPWKKLSSEAQNIFLYGSKQKWLRMVFSHPSKRSRWTEYVSWKGVITEATKRLHEAQSEAYKKKMHELMKHSICPSCKGTRLKPYPSAATIHSKTIAELCAMTIEETKIFLEKLPLNKEEKILSEDLLKEITKKLSFLIDVGLHYLSIDRTSPTLSGGEAQRVRLAAQLGCGLVGTTYVLDEPSIGLHPQDHAKLIQSLLLLKQQDNTIIVVEHDKDTISHADEIVDIGPYAGKRGGEVVAQGDLNDIMSNPQSLTGQYLSGKKHFPIRKKTRTSEEFFEVIGAQHNNLKNIDVKFPLYTFIGITGVSGSGKSSLISDTLFPLLSNELAKTHHVCGNCKSFKGLEKVGKVIFVDQSPIGRTYRSNPATYCKIFDDIRNFYASLQASKVKGFTPGHFSFNVREGSCPYCKGVGQVKIDMDFMEDTWIECFQCKGRRFDPEVLLVEYQDKNIYDVLEMEVGQAIEFFENIPYIRKKLEVLAKVGLDYIHLGQSATTLSGGEAQRIKLAKELIRPSTGNTFYILDEPTTGLHYYDMEKLLQILQELVDQKNTVLVVEHNFDFIKQADWIIDLGPKAGKEGGQIIAIGSPQKMSRLNTPTGKALKEALENFKIKSEKTKQQRPVAHNIIIEEAHQNNLKHLSLSIPHKQITAICGPSGAGKSSLAFDTIYAEGQRRYIDTLPPYAKQFLKQMPKPKAKQLDNLSPCIAIEQKNPIVNPRSTVGTLTETYDYLRIIYAHLGIPYCPETGEEIKTISKEYVLEKVRKAKPHAKIIILAPLKAPNEKEFDSFIEELNQKGFVRIRLNGTYYELDAKIPYDANLQNKLFVVVDRLTNSQDNESRLFEALTLAAKIGNDILTVDIDGKDFYYNLAFAVESTGKSYPPITPQSFSFNSEQGMCLECQGIGSIYGADLRSIADYYEFPIIDILYDLLSDDNKQSAERLLYKYFEKRKIDIYTPLNELSSNPLQLFLFGDDKPYLDKNGISFIWKGINNILAYRAKHAKHHIRYFLVPYMKEKLCPECAGARLNPLAQNVKIENTSIVELCQMPLEKTYDFCKKISKKAPEILKEPFAHILKKFSILNRLGVGYLSLNRSCPSLSSGEFQRIRLASELGLSLTSCTYILDEPTVGLHPHNIHLMTQALQSLKEQGNTIIMVEHDPQCIEKADLILDIGPKGGQGGGYLLAQGTLDQIKKNPKSITGQYLSGTKSIPFSKRKFLASQWIEIVKANLHNLKNIDVKLPYKGITALCGISGSGKSTLLFDLVKKAALQSIAENNTAIKLTHGEVKFAELFSQVISLDQSPIGTTSRADVCSYSEILTLLRTFYASLPQAKAKGLQPRHFSYNHKRGMCKTCRGLGYKIVDLQYLPSVKITCDECHGHKLNSNSLSIHYKGKNMGEVLELTIDEAVGFLEAFPRIVKKLTTLSNVGLGYLHLGQEINSLSGGEAQRLRLSKELAKRKNKNALYLFDEPSKGLHYEDIANLLPIFYELARENTLILIEHNTDIIKRCDYIIEMGPFGGDQGGQIIATGCLEEIKKNKKSLTAKYL